MPGGNNQSSATQKANARNPLKRKRDGGEPKQFFTLLKGNKIKMVKRPNNQSDESVKQKVLNYIENELKPSQLTDAMTDFVHGMENNLSLTDMHLHMAHAVSAKEIGEMIETAANEGTFTDLEDFAAGFISTDAEDEPALRALIRSAKPTRANQAPGIDELHQTFSRLNKSSGNLMPGHDRTNIKISKRRDHHRDRKGFLLRRSAKRAQLANHFLQKQGLSIPYPAMTDASGEEITSTLP